jgi:starch synthase
MIKNLQQVPLVLTTHSLEPHRPWKVEQLGNGYHLSSWIEKTAYQNAEGIIAVSNDMKKDVIDAYGVDEDKVRVIYNGIDPDFYTPTEDPEYLKSLGIDPSKPFILFVGRVTRQKGISHLLQAAKKINSDAQLVLCAGAPDTPEIEKECTDYLEALKAERDGVIWISEMLSHDKIKILYSMASVFTCPSLYEPFGIINLEAMSCGTPVVGSAVGGIPEIIVEGETGYLVSFDAKSKSNFEPVDAEKFHQDLADKINAILDNPKLGKELGIKARQRVEDVFSWKSIAKQTLEFYEETLAKFKAGSEK